MPKNATAKVVQLPTAMTPTQRMLTPKPDDITGIDFEEIVRLTGGSAANADNSDPVVLTGESAERVRRWAARYGFSRLPETYGELMGLYDYCNGLEVLSGFDSVAPHLLPTWQATQLRVRAKHNPTQLEPLRLYIEQDIDALRAFHDQQETLTKLGRNYNDVEREFEAD